MRILHMGSGMVYLMCGHCISQAHDIMILVAVEAGHGIIVTLHWEIKIEDSGVILVRIFFEFLPCLSCIIMGLCKNWQTVANGCSILIM